MSCCYFGFFDFFFFTADGIASQTSGFLWLSANSSQHSTANLFSSELHTYNFVFFSFIYNNFEVQRRTSIKSKSMAILRRKNYLEDCTLLIGAANTIFPDDCYAILIYAEKALNALWKKGRVAAWSAQGVGAGVAMHLPAFSRSAKAGILACFSIAMLII